MKNLQFLMIYFLSFFQHPFYLFLVTLVRPPSVVDSKCNILQGSQLALYSKNYQFGKIFPTSLKLDLLLASIRHGDERLNLVDRNLVGEVEWVTAFTLAPRHILSTEVVMPNLWIQILGMFVQNLRFLKESIQYFTSVTPFSTSQKTSTGCPEPSGSMV